jgi:glycosyltransferase involved in cell wall biosynthesis
MRVGINAHLLNLGGTYRNAGVSRYIYHLLSALPDVDQQNEYVIYTNTCPSALPVGQAPNVSVRAALLPTERPLARIAWEQTALPWSARRDRLDVLHAPVNISALVPAAPLVVTVHDLSFLRFPSRFVPAKRHYQTVFTRATVAQARRVIAVSESTKADLVRLLRVPAERVSVVHEGVEERFRPLPATAVDAFRRRQDLPDHFVLYVGSLEPRKNLPLLLRAYHRLRHEGQTDWPLVLAGGKGWLYEEIFRTVQDLGLQESVRFPGFVLYDELPLWYNAAGLFVYPSLYEGFGLPALEAMACGTPVVVSAASSLPEVVGSAGVVVDCAHDEVPLSRAMGELIGGAARRAHYAAAGPVRAATFSWTQAVQETVAVYRRTAEEEC